MKKREVMFFHIDLMWIDSLSVQLYYTVGLGCWIASLAVIWLVSHASDKRLGERG